MYESRKSLCATMLWTNYGADFVYQQVLMVLKALRKKVFGGLNWNVRNAITQSQHKC